MVAEAGLIPLLQSPDSASIAGEIVVAFLEWVGVLGAFLHTGRHKDWSGGMADEAAITSPAS